MMKVIRRWTKRVDTMHTFESCEDRTMCGRPMLGTNYAGLFKENDGVWTIDNEPHLDRPTCPECSAKMAEDAARV
jgi:hypothetical protein